MLLTGTVFCESGGIYLKQINGPALGLFQIEPRTHKDVKVWLQNGFNKGLLPRILASCFMEILPGDDALVFNLRYACLVARLIYWRAKPPLPNASDAKGMAIYHKKFYNTMLGDADPLKNEPIFKQVIDAS